MTISIDPNGLQTNSASGTIPSTQQTLAISLTAPTTSVNGNVSVQGLVNRSAAQGSHFNIAYVIDRSGSMSSTFQGTQTVPDLNHDGAANTLMDAAINSFQSLNASLIDAGFGSSTLGVIQFDDTVQTVYNGILDAPSTTNSGQTAAVDALTGITPNGWTSFDTALQQAIAFFQSAPAGNNVLYFISDGAHNGGSYTGYVNTLLADDGINATIRSIGLGAAASLSDLDLVDDGLANSSAVAVTDPSTLTAGLVAPPLNSADIDHVELLRNGTVVATLDPSQLTSTPLGLQFQADISGLGATNNLVARVVATDAAHTMVETNLPVTFNVPTPTAGVTITARDGYVTNEDGSGVEFSVSLNAAPAVVNGLSRIVVINFASSDTTEGAVVQSSLTFNASNWNVPQTLRVNGVQDYINDGTVAYHVSAAIAGTTTDVNYLAFGRGVGIPAIQLTNAPDVTNHVADPTYADGVDRDVPQFLVETIPANNVFVGLDGNDRLYGGYLLDDLTGGLGDDRLYGGYDDDQLDGGAGNDKLYGEQDDDHLVGGAGNDTLDGGLGLDTLIGGAGNDTYYLGYDATDVIDDQGLATDVDTVILPYVLTSYTLPNGIENGALSAGSAAANLTGNSGNNGLTGNDGANGLSGGTGNDTLTGGGGNDTLSGGTGADSLVGGNGNDTVNAGDGNDTIIGGDGAGNDSYRGDAGLDTVVYTSAVTGIVVNLTTGRASGTEIGNDTLTGIENVIGGQAGDRITGSVAANSLDGYTGNDTIDGGAGNDSLIGGTGNDSLIGGTGNDTLVGGAGNDTLVGGAGADAFKFLTRTDGRDTIADFVSGTDKIQVLSANFGAAPRFTTAATPSSAFGTFVYNATTGALAFDSNGNGAGGVSQIATLTGHPTLRSTDFQVVTA